MWKYRQNGNIIGFRPQTQNLESPYKTPSNTLEVKGLIEVKALEEPSFWDPQKVAVAA